MYGDSYTGRFRSFSTSWSDSPTVYAWYTFAAPSCAIALLTPTFISHDARRRNRCGNAFHTLYGSGPPIVPAVVTVTRTLVFADNAVRMPFGSPEPEPRVNLSINSSSYPAASRSPICAANPG